jgi:hypothetical protein
MPAMSKSAFAAHIGKTPGYVTQLAAAGRLVFAENGEVDAERSLELIEATAGDRSDVAERHAQARAAKVDKPASKDDGKLDQARAIFRFRADKAKALKLELELKRDAGELVEAQAAARAGAELGLLVRQGMETMIDRLSHELAPLRDPERIRAVMEENADALLEDFARKAQSFAKL